MICDCYNRYLVPRLVAMAMKDRVMTRQRAKIVPLAHGDVLEVGIGPGYNMPHYNQEQVNGLWAVEPSEFLRERSSEQAEAVGMDLTHLGLDGEEIPAEDQRFDSVVVTYALCTIPNAQKALSEIHRVLKPGGKIHFSEHGKAPDEDVQRRQNRYNALWRSVSGGCNMNRDIPALFQEAGFVFENLEQMYLPGFKVLMFNTWGTAVKPT